MDDLRPGVQFVHEQGGEFNQNPYLPPPSPSPHDQTDRSIQRIYM